MTDKPPLWADLLLTLWVLVVAVFFFGPVVAPLVHRPKVGQSIGLYTDSVGTAFYTLMVLVAAGTSASKYLHRNDAPEPPPEKKDTRAKKRKTR